MVTLSKRFLIIAGVGIIGVIILLVMLFKRGQAPDQDLIKQIIAAKDTVIKKENDKIALYERLIEEKEKTSEVLASRDSVLNAHYNETEKLYKDINAQIRTIPGRIARIASNNDSLRGILAEY